MLSSKTRSHDPATQPITSIHVHSNQGEHVNERMSTSMLSSKTRSHCSEIPDVLELRRGLGQRGGITFLPMGSDPTEPTSTAPSIQSTPRHILEALRQSPGCKFDFLEASKFEVDDNTPEFGSDYEPNSDAIETEEHVENMAIDDSATLVRSVPTRWIHGCMTNTAQGLGERTLVRPFAQLLICTDSTGTAKVGDILADEYYDDERLSVVSTLRPEDVRKVCAQLIELVPEDSYIEHSAIPWSSDDELGWSTTSEILDSNASIRYVDDEDIVQGAMIRLQVGITV